MAYVSCPMCGGPGAWEDEESTVFCPACEEKYQNESGCATATQEFLEEEDRIFSEMLDEGNLDIY